MTTAAAVIAGCAQDESSPAAPSTSPSVPATSVRSMIVSVPPAPVQTGTKKPVRFDPCTEVSDELVVQAGFDPATRERSVQETVTDLLTVIGCSFNRVVVVDGEKFLTSSVAVTARNSTLEEARASSHNRIFSSEPIAGREAVLYTMELLPQSCYAEIQTTEGTLEVMVSTFPGPVADPVSCDQIRGIATIFAGALGAK